MMATTKIRTRQATAGRGDPFFFDETRPTDTTARGKRQRLSSYDKYPTDFSPEPTIYVFEFPEDWDDDDDDSDASSLPRPMNCSREDGSSCVSHISSENEEEPRKLWWMPVCLGILLASFALLRNSVLLPTY